MVDYYTKELINKKISKSGLEKVLASLTKTMNWTVDKQISLEKKVDELGKQNEEFIIQNQQMLHETLNNK